MSRLQISPSGVERTFGDDEIIVSKTDLAGRITYANDVFVRVSGYTAGELIGAPHSIIRHPDMPRCVFRLLWDTLESGKEVFAYVLNLAKTGDHYWVFAHVTPSFDAAGRIVGYHSNRRTPDRRVLPSIESLYATLLEVERGVDRREQVAASTALLTAALAGQEKDYDAFVWSL